MDVGTPVCQPPSDDDNESLTWHMKQMRQGSAFVFTKQVWNRFECLCCSYFCRHAVVTGVKQPNLLTQLPHTIQQAHIQMFFFHNLRDCKGTETAFSSNDSGSCGSADYSIWHINQFIFVMIPTGLFMEHGLSDGP